MEMAGIPPPKMDWDSSNLPDSWDRFQAHVELIFKGPLKDKAEEHQIAYLLLWVGDKVREIHRTWTIPADDQKKIGYYYKGFKDYVRPKLNPIFARFKFHNELQGADSFTSFLTRLRVSVKDCEYGEKADEMIRDRIVFGTNSSKIRQKLINVGKDLTLDQTVQIAQSHEYSQEQLKSMSADVSYVKNKHSRKRGKPNAINKSQLTLSGRSAPHQPSQPSGKDKTGKEKQKPCGNCGNSHQTGSCPAKANSAASAKSLTILRVCVGHLVNRLMHMQ